MITEYDKFRADDPEANGYVMSDRGYWVHSDSPNDTLEQYGIKNYHIENGLVCLDRDYDSDEPVFKNCVFLRMPFVFGECGDFFIENCIMLINSFGFPKCCSNLNIDRCDALEYFYYNGVCEELVLRNCNALNRVFVAGEVNTVAVLESRRLKNIDFEKLTSTAVVEIVDVRVCDFFKFPKRVDLLIINETGINNLDNIPVPNRMLHIMNNHKLKDIRGLAELHESWSKNSVSKFIMNDLGNVKDLYGFPLLKNQERYSDKMIIEDARPANMMLPLHNAFRKTDLSILSYDMALTLLLHEEPKLRENFPSFTPLLDDSMADMLV